MNEAMEHNRVKLPPPPPPPEITTLIDMRSGKPPKAEPKRMGRDMNRLEVAALSAALVGFPIGLLAMLIAKYLAQ